MSAHCFFSCYFFDDAQGLLELFSPSIPYNDTIDGGVKANKKQSLEGILYDQNSGMYTFYSIYTKYIEQWHLF